MYDVTAYIEEREREKKKKRTKERPESGEPPLL